MSNGTEITVTTVHLTSAQILALFSSPVQIVGPQGLKTIIIPVFCILRYNSGSTQYTVGAGNLLVGPTPALPTSGMFGTSPTILSIPQNEYTFMTPTSNLQVSAPNTENQGISIGVATQNPTLGNGSLDVVLGYQIVTMP